MQNPVHYVNNTAADLSDPMLYDAFAEAYKTGKLPEELADLFSLTILRGYNDDGSDRVIIDFA